MAFKIVPVTKPLRIESDKVDTTADGSIVMFFKHLYGDHFDKQAFMVGGILIVNEGVEITETEV